MATFHVADKSDSGNLISANTAQELRSITLHVDNVVSNKKGNIDSILNKHSKVFTGLGKLKQHQVTFNIDKTVAPKAQPQRRIPYHIRDKVKSAIEILEQDDVIEKVPESQPTPSVSPIVAVSKDDGGVRICVDMRQANNAIKRVRYHIPTVKDIRQELNGGKWFSKLDLSQAYHHLELSDSSRFITKFSTN